MSQYEQMQPGWYLLKTKRREELRARDHLDNQGFDTYCPEVQKLGETQKKLLFPGYLFLSLGLKDLEKYYKIRSTRGVSEIINFKRITKKLHEDNRLSLDQSRAMGGVLPEPIPNGEAVIQQVNDLITVLQTQPQDNKKQFKAGDNVIIDNPLYKHLQATFIKGLNMDRGLVLINYIKSQRNAAGHIEKSCVASGQKVAIKIRELEFCDKH
ncbi:Transcription antitermination protein RfaH [invertebrate metagenome]|uniref:Transcription antitermination protein RfaH n=1 Tax=invertebrate metagenome TaxID=1711999 RepID=A0A2H9T913_9ZZZZ